MDRTAWIVVTLCTLGLIAWFFSQPKPPPRQDQPVVQAALPSTAPPPTATPDVAPPPPSPAVAPEEKTFVITDEGVAIEFTTRGGGIKSATIPALADFAGFQPMVLNEFGHGAVGALSGATGQVETEGYELKSELGQTPVIFERTTEENVLVHKEWSPVSHDADKGFLWQLRLQFKNQGAQSYAGKTWFVYTGAVHPLRRNDSVPAGAVWNADGEADWDGQGIVFDGKPKDQLEKKFGQLLWAGVRSQYYVTLIAHSEPLRNLPPGSLWANRQRIDFSAHQQGKGEVFAAEAGFGLPPLDLAAGAESSQTLEVYVGPRARSVLAKLDKRPEAGRHYADVMFYGWWGFVSRRMLWLLTVFQNWLGGFKSSWGLAIILLTLVVRGLMWPLTIKSTRQMKRMSLLGPQMKDIQAKYKEEPQRMNAEVMKLYKKYGVNPLNGCLPVAIQIPIFFGLYRMLQSAVELRGHGIWWVDDLSMPDTESHLPQWLPWMFGGMAVNPLPLIMAGTMFVQMLMTPKSPDPNMQQQQKILMIMPFFFLFVCYDFASALALYWTISNIIGIVQSWVTKRLPEPALVERPPGAEGDGGAGKRGGKPPKGGGGKPSFMELFAHRLAEQQKQAATKRDSRTGGGRGSAFKKRP